MGKDYCKYKADDFIQDDFFIRSIYFPTFRSRIFWNSQLRKRKIEPDEYSLAVKYLTIVSVKKKDFSKEEKEVLKKKIYTNLKFEPVIKRRKYLYVYSSVACIVVLVVSIFMVHSYITRDPLTKYANSSQIKKSEKIELILSEDKRLALQEENVSIQYGKSGEITVNKEKLEQKKNTINKKEKESLEYNQLIVPYGKRSTLILSDQTRILVNAGTRIIYPETFSTDKREIFVDGEVFLDVFPDPNRPFLVKTSKMQVTVTGTSFNVTAYQDDTEQSVVLVKGSVIVNDKKNKSILKPNDRFLDKSGIVTVKQVDVTNYISWKEGVYIFKREPLKDILARVARYYDVKIQVDEKSAMLSCSGKLDLKEDVARVMKALTITAPVTFLENDKNVYVFSYEPSKE